METEDFAKFVASQQQSGVEVNVDWTEMRNEWLQHLDVLYRKVEGFLQEYITDGLIRCSFSEIELDEPDMGKYLAKRMDIRIGKQHVSLLPVGTQLIGCKGRVDVEGSAGSAQLLLLDKRAKRAADLIKDTVSIEENQPETPATRQSDNPPISWVWKIVTHSMDKRFVDLDKESFFSLLMEISNA